MLKSDVTSQFLFQTSSTFSLLKLLQRNLVFYSRGSVDNKVKWSRYRPGMAQRVGRGIALLFHDRGTRRGEWSAARPCRTLPRGKTRYPFYRRLGGLQSRFGRAENLVPTGIRSRTVQPLVSSYTDWATGPTEGPLIRSINFADNHMLIIVLLFSVEQQPTMA